MLLMKLEANEKFSFLQLAHYLARVDNSIDDTEEEIILEYCSEMGIDNTSFAIESFDLEKILKSFKTKKSKRIVLLELMILIHIDNDFNIDEKYIVDKISVAFDITKGEIETYSRWGKSVSKLYTEAKNIID